MNKKTQHILGDNNVQIIADVVNYNTKDICNGIGKSFSEYDIRVEKYYPNGIKVSKINEQTKKFESTKIFSSLVKIDIPFENALQITYFVVLHLISELENGNYKEDLSTHVIRKIVQEAILNYSDGDVSEEIKEKWADKYVRRYGHDAQQVQIYFSNSTRLEALDFKFVKKTLLEDIFNELGIREKAYKKEISSKQIATIGREIIEFINNCNMYKVNYDTLKQFVIEMALQPPHPWFVTEETAIEISKYDLEILKMHYKILKEAVDSGRYDNLFYRIYEALHHACSSILAKYGEVLGCKDLDVFYNLERITTELCKREETHLLMETQMISTFPNDLKYIYCNISSFRTLIRRIKNKIEIGKIVSVLDKELVEDVIDLCEIAFELDKAVNKIELKRFVESDWGHSIHEDKIKFIRRIFYIIDGLEVDDFNKKCIDCFWIKRSIKIEKKIFVICMDNKVDTQKIIEFYSKNKVVLQTEAIFIVLETEDEYARYKKFIDELRNEKYFIEIVSKEDLKKILISVNKYKAFIDIFNRD